MQQVFAPRSEHTPTTLLLVQLNSLKNHAVPAKAVLINARVTTVIVSILSIGEAGECARAGDTAVRFNCGRLRSRVRTGNLYAAIWPETPSAGSMWLADVPLDSAWFCYYENID
jgi:hypothetical protein